MWSALRSCLSVYLDLSPPGLACAKVAVAITAQHRRERLCSGIPAKKSDQNGLDSGHIRLIRCRMLSVSHATAIVATAVVLAIGFCLGFAVRSLISRARRRRWKKQM